MANAGVNYEDAMIFCAQETQTLQGSIVFMSASETWKFLSTRIRIRIRRHRDSK
jgi:hypothetical protein